MTPTSLADRLSVSRRVLILVMVVMGATLYSTTLLTASTLLPQMQGAMSATQDEVAWAMTFNILATAVVTPMTQSDDAAARPADLAVSDGGPHRAPRRADFPECRAFL